MTDLMLKVLRAAKECIPNEDGTISVEGIAIHINISVDDVRSCLIRLENWGGIKVKRTVQYKFYLNNDAKKKVS